MKRGDMQSNQTQAEHSFLPALKDAQIKAKGSTASRLDPPNISWWDPCSKGVGAAWGAGLALPQS